jgi:hypothetical protein
MSQIILSYYELKKLFLAFEKNLAKPKNILLHINLINEHINYFYHRSLNALEG